MRRDARGFTLIEVIVALTILGLVLGIAYRVHATTLNGMAKAERLQRAAFVADSLLAQLGTSLPLRAGDSLAGTSAGMPWTIAVTRLAGSGAPVALKAGGATLVAVTVRVEAGADGAIELTTRRLATLP